MDDAKYQIADLAILAAAKVIKKNVGGDSDRETVDEFLSEVSYICIRLTFFLS